MHMLAFLYKFICSASTENESQDTGSADLVT